MHNNNNPKRRPNTMNNGNNRHHSNNRPRHFNNNGRGRSDDNSNVARTRRNATQSREKYQMLARDAMSMGDRVLAENYLQHADHYHRVLIALPPEEIRQPYPPRTPQQGAAEGDMQNDMQHDSHHDTGNGMHEEDLSITSTSSTALPSFITQPTHMDQPQPHSHEAPEE